MHGMGADEYVIDDYNEARAYNRLNYQDPIYQGYDMTSIALQYCIVGLDSEEETCTMRKFPCHPV